MDYLKWWSTLDMSVISKYFPKVIGCSGSQHVQVKARVIHFFKIPVFSLSHVFVAATRLRSSSLKFQHKQAMDFFLKGMNGDGSECPFDVKDIQRCPFLRNINEPTSFSFSSTKLSLPVHGAKGPIFEDGPSFDMAFKLFHGKDGVIPLSEKSDCHNGSTKAESVPVFNPLAGRAATISLSSLGLGGPFSFDNFSEKWKKQKNSEASNKKEYSPQKRDASKHEALGNEWLANGNCPIAKSYRAVSNVLPLVATALRPPSGVKLKCPPAIVAARAALARTSFVKNLRPQPLPAKMLVIAALGMAVNVPFGMWKEHTMKFSLSWFIAVHAAVPFIAMLRKSVMMPKSAMALTIAASIIGQVIGSRAERIRMKTIAAEMGKVKAETVCSMETLNNRQLGDIMANHCGAEGMVLKSSLPVKDTGSTSTASVCY